MKEEAVLAHVCAGAATQANLTAASLSLHRHERRGGFQHFTRYPSARGLELEEEGVVRSAAATGGPGRALFLTMPGPG